MKYKLTAFILFLILTLTGTAAASDLVFMVLDHNSYLAHTALKEMSLPDELKSRIRIITSDDVRQRPEQARQLIKSNKLIVIDVMGRELESFLTTDIELSSKTIYALRGSTDDEALKKKGLIFDPDVSIYYRHISTQNIQSMLRLILSRHMDKSITFDPVIKQPQLGLYHPEKGVFSDIETYLDWQKQRPGYDPMRPKIGFLFFSSFLTRGQIKPMDTIILRLEKEGFNVIPCFGRERQAVEAFFLDKEQNSRVDMVLTFSFKFNNMLTPELAQLVRKLDVPVFSAVSTYKDTIEQWRKSPLGLDVMEIAWSIAVPEISGLIEPTVLLAKEKVTDPDTGKTYFISREVTENIDRLIPRLKKWVVLQRKPNKDKKIALMFYNHHQGKQNVGASYLNVFRSIEEIFNALGNNGYNVGKPLSEQEIKNLILTSARNIGSWAPGELDKMLASGKVIRVPLKTYKKWFKELPEDFQKKVIDQWGGPETAGIMVSDNSLIIPAVQANNVILLPEPSRGWGDDPMKLYHDTTLYPHHQYLAVYLWLSKAFKADAMIHLGTHSTYEWTPGKQAGLSPSCAPEVLITDIPNLYPYIVDDVGEGIQAKRRGRGVIISHMTPVLRKAGIAEEYSRMAELVGEIERAKARGSVTVAEKVKELMQLAGQTGILKDLEHEARNEDSHDHDHGPDLENMGIDPDTARTVHLLGHYLEEIKEAQIPYGMHTFGRSPEPEALVEMTGAVHEANPEYPEKKVESLIRASGPDEMKNLLAGLEGRYVPPGQGNDPIRNPEALPTGKNFYGFNPVKLPSPAAWELGKKAAQQIIDNHITKQGTYPQKVAIVLWAVETLRNEGVNEATIMYLIGTKPKWSRTGRVLGIDVIKGKTLGRPRIDVMINASGLYRDLFPEKLMYLDKAIRLAVKQTDVENLIARHNAKIKTRLIQQGMAPEEAEEMSRFRIFSEPPGAYGNGVSEMAGGSSKWDNPDQVVDVYENRMGFAFGQSASGRQWGVSAKKTMKAQLAQVDVAVHSQSSNVYGLLDNDDMFQYLGGLSMAVRKESGKAPETLITAQQQKGQVRVEDMGKTLGREMRARYLNPKWIKGMKAEGYAGARAMANFVEYLWGWNMTTPEKVDAQKWNQTFDVYVKDKYNLDLKQFFDKASPWAYQSVTARMLETHRKGYWKADQKQLETLAAEYAKSVVAKGIACCDHTCNNPMLNQMVVSIISIPGVLSPEIVEKFKLAVEQAAQKPLEEQVKERRQLLEKLAAPSPDQQQTQPSQVQDSKDQQTVEGYKMEPMDKKEDKTEMTSSGVEWMAIIAVLGILALVTWGARKNK